jgi:hypothetical protein
MRRKWVCTKCGDKCTREGTFLQPINCPMYSWERPHWCETSKAEEHNAVKPSGSSSGKPDSGGATVAAPTAPVPSCPPSAGSTQPPLNAMCPNCKSENIADRKVHFECVDCGFTWN